MNISINQKMNNMKNKPMKIIDDFILFDNIKTTRFYKPESRISYEIEPLDFILSAFFSFLFTTLFNVYFFEREDFKSAWPVISCFLVLFIIFFFIFKRKKIAHNFNISMNESYRARFEDSLIYNEERFNELMYILFPYLKDENANTVLTNVITKNFSSRDFEILYNACVEVKKNSLAFIDALNKEKNVIFFTKKD